MMGRIFYFISSILMLVAAFVILAPSLLTPGLIYPERVDSAYIAFHATRLDGGIDSLTFDPSGLDLPYSDVSIKTNNGLHLKGWYIQSTDTPANTIILIHDVEESKILYLDHMKQFHDRGFNVCMFDMRAHGNSEGTEFSAGIPAVDDVKTILDSLVLKKGNKHFVLMGIGLGAAIALQVAACDNRVGALVLQSPINTFENFVERYSSSKWGIMSNIWLPVFKRKLETLLQFPVKELDLRVIASYDSVPAFFILGSDDAKVFTSETLQVFDASATEKKELFLVRNANHENIAKTGGEIYYNRIASFLINTLPKEQKTTRYKKLALND